MSEIYAPLRMLKMVYEETGGKSPYEAQKSMFRMFASARRIPFRDYTEEEIIHYLSSPLAGLDIDLKNSKRYENLYVDKLRFERDIKLAPKFSYMSLVFNEFLNATADLRSGFQMDFYAEMKDEFLYPNLLGVWARNKQVFKPDIDFARMLLDTEITYEEDGKEITEPGVFITRDAIDHLPYDYLYVDLEDCSELFGRIKGFFIFADSTYISVETSMYILVDTDELDEESGGLCFFSHYSGGMYGSDGMLTMSMSKMGADNADYSGELGNAELKEEDTPVDRKRVSIFAMQVLTYISSKEPDILESPITSGTYKKPSKKAVPKNDMSEVQIWEVGVKYGAAWRFAKKEREKEDGSRRNSSGTRRSPLPYYRRAHWQRFWTGKGRTVCTVKWISPVFVMGQSKVDLEQTDVKIHKIGDDAK